MKNVQLLRISNESAPFTSGVLVFDGIPRLVTHELPWLNNEEKRSCIPEGEYECHLVRDRILYGGYVLRQTFEVSQVPNRTGILFHTGNGNQDTLGCILVASEYGENPNGGVSRSRIGFTRFLGLLDGFKSFTLNIKRVS